jgi:hypothetical protein
MPAGPDDLAPHYDLTVGVPAAHHLASAAFLCQLAEAAKAHGLTAAVLHDGTVHEAVRRLGDGRLTVGVHLDFFARWHLPDDPYAWLAQVVADAGGCPVNPPARARIFADKAAAHAELVRRGLGVPDTLLVRPRTPDRQASYPVHLAVSCPRLECADCVVRPARWRVLHCLGDLTPFWWSAQGEGGRPSCRLVTREEIRCHRLRPVLEYAAALAGLSGLGWFSTELCLTDGPEPSRYRVPAGGGRTWAVLALGYINDPCDASMQSGWPGSLPEEVVRHVAGRFAEAAWLCRHTGGPASEAEPLRHVA